MNQQPANEQGNEILLMAAGEAREKTERIRANLTEARRLLLEMYEREGWRALGYESWRKYGQAEFGYSERRVYELMNAAKVERNICAMAQKPISERALRPLTKLDPDDQREAWQRAVETAPDGRVTGAHVEATVEEYQAEKDGDKRDGMAVHYSSKYKDWETPQDLFDLLDREFLFTLDVCATDKTAKCESYFTPEDDGLAQEWEGHRCWMNPPYGDEISKWVEKAYRAAQVKGTLVVCLLPARTDTSWWWDYCRHGQIRFLRGRLKFGGAEHSAPFPSAVVVFDGYRKGVIWWEAPDEI